MIHSLSNTCRDKSLRSTSLMHNFSTSTRLSWDHRGANTVMIQSLGTPEQWNVIDNSRWITLLWLLTSHSEERFPIAIPEHPTNTRVHFKNHAKPKKSRIGCMLLLRRNEVFGKFGIALNLHYHLVVNVHVKIVSHLTRNEELCLVQLKG